MNKLNHKKFSVLLLGFSLLYLASSHSAKAAESCPIVNTSATEQASSPRKYTCEGENYFVSVPPSCASGGCGLIIDIHGGGMFANEMNKGTNLRYLGWNAEERGASSPYIVVQPSLTKLSYFAFGQIDAEKVFRFAEEVAIAWQVDDKRIHVDGFSYGSDSITAANFVCDHNDFFASYGLISGSTSIPCIPPTNPILDIAGNQDAASSGLERRSTQYFDTIQSGGHSVSKSYKYKDENWASPRFTFAGGFFPVLAGRHEHIRYTGGGYHYETIRHSGAPVDLALLLIGMGLNHCLSVGLDWRDNNGLATCLANFHVGEKLIDFYIAHPKP